MTSRGGDLFRSTANQGQGHVNVLRSVQRRGAVDGVTQHHRQETDTKSAEQRINDGTGPGGPG